MEDIPEEIMSELASSSKEVFFETIFASSSSSSSSSDSSESNERHPKITNFIGIIDNYNETEFKSHLRLKRSTVEYIISIYSESGFSPNVLRHGGHSKMGCKKEVLMFIWYLSNTITFRQLSNLFGVAKSSAWMAVGRVSRWLVSVGNQFVKWPQGDVVKEIAKKFESKKKIPGILGAIDCTHITINAPKLHRHCYFYRKRNYSIVLQAVVDADKKFIDIFCGEPGSIHDSRILKRSPLYRKAHENYQHLFPYNSFLIGDSAYSTSNWLVPPFRDNGRLTESQINFNKRHSSTRIVVENTFALLKCRFRRLLKFTEQRTIKGVMNLVASGCILHNICLTLEDEFESEEIEEENLQTENSDTDLNVESDRRQVLFEYLRQKRII